MFSWSLIRPRRCCRTTGHSQVVLVVVTMVFTVVLSARGLDAAAAAALSVGVLAGVLRVLRPATAMSAEAPATSLVAGVDDRS